MSRLAGDAALVTALSAASLVVGLLTYPVIAARFTLLQTDEFFLALTLPWLLVGPIMNSVGSVLVPVLADCERNRPAALEPTLGAALAASATVAIIGAVAIGLVAPLLFAATGAWLTAAAASRIAVLTLWLLPLALLQAAASVLGAGANAAGRFWLPAGAGLAQQVLALCVLALADPGRGSLVLVAAYMAGGALNLALLWTFWPKDWARIRPGFHKDAELAKVARMALPIFAGTLLLQAGVVATRLIASTAGEGGVSALEYASRGAGVILELLGSGILVVVLTAWSQTSTAFDPQALRRRLRETIQMMLFLSAPAVAVVYALREPLVELWLPAQTGAAFRELVAAVLGFFLLAIPLDIASRLCARYFLVTGKTAILATTAAVRVALTVVIALVLVDRLGVLAVSLADCCGVAATLGVLAWRSLGREGISADWRELLRTAGACLGAWLGAAAALHAAREIAPLPLLALGTIGGACAGLLAAWLAGSAQLSAAWSLIRRRIIARS